jgi:hypothetical protein
MARFPVAPLELKLICEFLEGDDRKELRAVSFAVGGNPLSLVEQLKAMTKKVGEVHQKLRDARHCIHMRHLRDHEDDSDSSSDDGNQYNPRNFPSQACTTCGRDGGGSYFEVAPDNRVMCGKCIDHAPVRLKVICCF